jgi:hypothetical protein
MSDQTPQYPQPPYGAPQPEPKRKSWFARHKIMTGLLVIVVLAIIGSAMGSGSGSSSSDNTASDNTASTSNDSSSTSDNSNDSATDAQPASNPDEGTVEIIVKSTQSKGGSVTYVKPGGNFDMSQDTSAKFPWHKTFQTSDSLVPGWNMNAQQNGGGTLTCIVKQDGQVIAKNSSNGNYSMVTCTPQG